MRAIVRTPRVTGRRLIDSVPRRGWLRAGWPEAMAVAGE